MKDYFGGKIDILYYISFIGTHFRAVAKNMNFKLTSKTGMQQAVALITRQRQLQVDGGPKGSNVCKYAQKK